MHSQKIYYNGKAWEGLSTGCLPFAIEKKFYSIAQAGLELYATQNNFKTAVILQSRSPEN